MDPRQVCENQRPSLPDGIKHHAMKEMNSIMRRVSTVLIPALALSCIALMTVTAGAQKPGGSPEGKKLKNPVASSPESIKAGAAPFPKNCRLCHRADAEGGGPVAPQDTHPPNPTHG